MDGAVYKREVRGRLYQVFYDEFPKMGVDFDFESDEDNKAYFQRFLDGDLCSYWVSVSVRCDSCSQWHLKDSLGQIHAVNFAEALESYLGNCEGEYQ